MHKSDYPPSWTNRVYVSCNYGTDCPTSGTGQLRMLMSTLSAIKDKKRRINTSNITQEWDDNFPIAYACVLRVACLQCTRVLIKTSAASFFPVHEIVLPFSESRASRERRNNPVRRPRKGGAARNGEYNVTALFLQLIVAIYHFDLLSKSCRKRSTPLLTCVPHSTVFEQYLIGISFYTDRPYISNTLFPLAVLKSQDTKYWIHNSWIKFVIQGSVNYDSNQSPASAII